MREQHGITFLLVKHDIPVSMDISDKNVLLDFGGRIANGTPTDVQSKAAVIAASLGSEH